MKVVMVKRRRLLLLVDVTSLLLLLTWLRLTGIPAVVLFLTFPKVDVSLLQIGDSEPIDCDNLALNDSRVKDILNLAISQDQAATRIGGQFVAEITDEVHDKESTHCVPKILHFIWTGSVIPQKYANNIRTFVENNPQYQIILWTDKFPEGDAKKNLSTVKFKNIKRELRDYYVRDLYNSEKNIGARSDIIRYEIVYRHGGIYLDTDSVSLAPLNDLLTYSFVAHYLEDFHNIANGIFGFPKGSRFLKFVLEALPRNMYKRIDKRVEYRTGPIFFSGCFVRFNDPLINMIGQEYLVIRQKTNSTNTNTTINTTNTTTNSSITGNITNIQQIVYQSMDATWAEKDPTRSQWETAVLPTALLLFVLLACSARLKLV